MKKPLILIIFCFAAVFYSRAEIFALPHIATKDGWQTRLVLENYGFNDASVEMSLYENGQSLIPETLNVSHGGNLVYELTSGDCGILSINSSNLVAKIAYFHQYQLGVAEFILSPVSPETREMHLLFPDYAVDNLTWQGLAIMNASVSKETITMEAFSNEGILLETVSLDLQSFQKAVGKLESFFQPGRISRVRVSSQNSLAGLTLSGQENARLLFVPAVVSNQTQRTLIIPHIAEQRETWSNLLVFDNTGSLDASPRLSLFRNGKSVYDMEFFISKGATRVLDLNEPEYDSADCGFISNVPGTLHVRSSFIVQGTGNSQGGATAEFLLREETSQDEVISFPFYARAELDWMGLALYNQSNNKADVILKTFDQGLETGRIQVQIPGHSRFVGTLENVFGPEITTHADRVVASSCSDISGIQISGNGQERLLFTTSQPFLDNRTFLEKLNAIPGVTISPVEPVEPFTTCYRVEITQSVDQINPDGQTFTQACWLNHRDENAPMVMYTGGYMLRNNHVQELTDLLTSNQLIVPHRFFEGARIEPADYEKMTIKQSAYDLHRIVLLFKDLYRQNWVDTGGSKGGMTSIFHRRFFPEDVQATVAYVAPILTGLPDPRFQEFVDETAGTAPCRAALREHQRTMLSNREEMISTLHYFAQAYGQSYDRVGLDRAFEYMVMEYPVAYWQYGGNNCDSIPASSSSTYDMAVHLLNTVGFLYSDQDLNGFEPFYFQAVTEFGYYGFMTESFQDLLISVPNPTWNDFIPLGTQPQYDPTVMQDIIEWVQSEGDHMIFLYGGNDPWTSCQVELTGGTDALKLIEPQKNHGVRIYEFSERDQIYQLLENWLDMDLVKKDFKFQKYPVENRYHAWETIK